MRSAAREAGLVIADYKSEIGFTAVREDDGRYFIFALNSGEWELRDAASAALMAGGRGPASFVAMLRRYFNIREPMPDAAE